MTALNVRLLSIRSMAVISWLIAAPIARGTTIEHNIIVDPVFTHTYQYEPEDEVSRLISSLRVDLPAVTLAPGDVHRVIISFEGSKYLQIHSAPEDGYVDHRLSLIDASIESRFGRGAAGTNGMTKVELFDNLLQPVGQVINSPASHYLAFFEDTIHWTQASYRILAGPDDAILPAKIGRLLFEFKAPTAIVEGSPPDAPYLTTTFTNNRVFLEFVSHRIGPEALDIAPGLTVVPEPTALLLAAIAIFGSWTAVRSRCRA